MVNQNQISEENPPNRLNITGLNYREEVHFSKNCTKQKKKHNHKSGDDHDFVYSVEDIEEMTMILYIR